MAFGIGRTLINRAEALEGSYQQQADKHARAYAERANVAIESRCRPLAAPAQLQCIREEREAARQGIRGERELEAQAITTAWTKYTDIGVVFGTSAGILGLMLVLATFWQNKRSADAAHDANRPWIDILIEGKPALYIYADRAYTEVSLKLVNRGNSPATHVAAIAQLVGNPIIGGAQDRAPIKALETLFDGWRAHDRLFGYTVFPGVTTDPQCYTANFMAEEWLAMCDGEAKPMALYLGVGVRYRFGDGTARTLYGYQLIDGSLQNLGSAFELAPRIVTGESMRVVNGFRGYAT